MRESGSHCLYLWRYEHRRMPCADVRAKRANRVFYADKKYTYRNPDCGQKQGRLEIFMRDRQLRTDDLLIRAQSTIRADGF